MNDLPNIADDRDVVAKRLRLAEYWFRARLMHELLHTLMGIYDNDLDALDKDGHAWEFLTYLDYWLSALFVAVVSLSQHKPCLKFN